MTKALATRCIAKSKQTMKQCKNKAIIGGTTCRFHGGASPKVAANAAVRAEVMRWGLQDVHEDPGEVLLMLVSQSASRCRRFAAAIEKEVDELGLAAALTGEITIPTRNGSYVAGEYIRSLAQLESQERDRCANFATKAIAAGLAERQVRLAEQQG